MQEPASLKKLFELKNLLDKLDLLDAQIKNLPMNGQPSPLRIQKMNSYIELGRLLFNGFNCEEINQALLNNYDINKKPHQELREYILKLEELLENLVNKNAKGIIDISKRLNKRIAEFNAYYSGPLNNDDRELAKVIQGNNAKTPKEVLDKITNNSLAINTLFEETLQDSIQTKADEIKKKIREELAAVSPIDVNTLEIYVFYLNGVVPGSKKVFGRDSTGHIAVRAKRINPETKNEETIYLSFYANKAKNKEPSRIAKLAKKLGLPSTDNRKGVFATFEQDMYRFYVSKGEQSYSRCERVVLRCDKAPCLDIKEIYEWIKGVINNPDLAYNFYSENCSTVALKALEAGGANPPKNLINSPADVKRYTERLTYQYEQEKLNNSLANIDTAKSRVKSRLNYIIGVFQNQIGRYTFEKNDESIRKLQNLIEILNPYITKVNDSTDTVTLDKDLLDLNNRVEEINAACIEQNDFNVMVVEILNSLRPILPKAIQNKTRINLVNLINSFIGSCSQLTISLSNEIGSIKSTLVSLLTEIQTSKHVSVEQLTKAQQDLSQINKKINNKALDFILIRANDLINLLDVNENKLIKAPRSTLLNISAKLNGLIENIPTEIYEMIGINQSDRRQLNNFATEFSTALKSSVGELNADLYFNTYANPDPNDKHHLLKHLQRLLPVDPNQVYVSVEALIDAVVKTLEEKTGKARLDQLSQEISSHLKAKKSYQAKRNDIQKIFKYRFTLSEEEKTLQNQANIICILRAFNEGELSVVEFQQALRDIAANASKAVKERINNFVESFCIQAYVEDISGDSQPKVKYSTIKKFNHYDGRAEKLISEDEAESFQLNLPSRTSINDLHFSSYMLVFEFMKHVFNHTDYQTIMGDTYGIAAFNHAIAMGFDRGGKDKTNQQLADKRLALDVKQSLTDAEAAFVDIYHGIELITKVFNAPQAFSHTEIKKQLLALDKTKKTTAQSLYSNEMKGFYQAIKSACYTHNIHNEVVIDNLSKQKIEFKKVLTDFKVNILKDKNLFLSFKDKVQLEENVVANHFGNKSDGEIIGLLTKVQKFDDISDNEHLLKDLSTFWGMVNSDHANLADIKMLFGTFSVLTEKLSNIKSAKSIHEPLLDLRKYLKDKLDGLAEDGSFNAPNNEDVKNLRNIVNKHLQTTLAVVNNELYFSDKKLQVLLGNFLQVPEAKYKTMDTILNQAETSVYHEIESQMEDDSAEEVENTEKYQNHYKIQLIKIVRDFGAGKIDEKEFYHQLSNYIEDHKPRFSVPGMNWLYRWMISDSDLANQYADMPNLEKFKECFENKYVQLEVKRMAQKPQLLKKLEQHQQLIIQINQQIDAKARDMQNQVKQAENLLNKNEPNQQQRLPEKLSEADNIDVKPLEKRAEQDTKAFSWAEKHRCKFANAWKQFSAISSITADNKELDKAKAIELQLKQEHYSKRLAESYTEAPTIKR